MYNTRVNMMISPILKKRYFILLDKVQAFELCGVEFDHREFMISLLPEIRKLYLCAEEYNDSTMLENQMQKIESILDTRLSCSNQSMQRDVSEFIVRRREISYIEDIVGEMNIRESKTARHIEEFKKEFQEFKDYLLNDFVTDNNHKCNTSVTNTVNAKQRTVNGKLVKEHNCAVCGSVFNSHRMDALYCSVKCKQMAYRSRKYKNEEKK